MIKVITYGTYDLLHYGHIKLLERAKALGDYLLLESQQMILINHVEKLMCNNP